jgi:hypothetical protein
MKKPTLIITNAIIWTVVILACSIALKGTETFQDIQSILAGGAVVSMFALAVAGKQSTSKSK